MTNRIDSRLLSSPLIAEDNHAEERQPTQLNFIQRRVAIVATCLRKPNRGIQASINKLTRLSSDAGMHLQRFESELHKSRKGIIPSTEKATDNIRNIIHSVNDYIPHSKTKGEFTDGILNCFTFHETRTTKLEGEGRSTEPLFSQEELKDWTLEA